MTTKEHGAGVGLVWRSATALRAANGRIEVAWNWAAARLSPRDPAGFKPVSTPLAVTGEGNAAMK